MAETRHNEDPAPDTLRSIPIVTPLQRVEEVRRLAEQQDEALNFAIDDCDDDELDAILEARGFLRRFIREAELAEDQLRRRG